MDSIELVKSGIPANFAIEKFEQDHFFAAAAAAITDVRRKLKLDPKQLRTKCKTFVDERIKDASLNSRIVNILSNRSKYNTIPEYCFNIERSAEECARYGIEIPILGQPDIEGRFISEMFNVDIHLIECDSEGKFKHQIIKKDAMEEVQAREISYKNTNLVHIVKINEEYGAAIQSKIVQNNQPGKNAGVDKKRGGTIDFGRSYEEGISAHIAIQCSLNEKIEDFYLFNNVDGLGAFDDVVLNIKFEEGEENELYAFQLKHKENNKISISNVFENKNEMFYLPKYEDSFNQICELYKNNSNSDIFENVKLDNIKFIFYSNIKFDNKDVISTNKYVFTKDSGCADVMKAFSTKLNILPYKIAHIDPSSRKNVVSNEFLSKCWVYPNQINANEIEELVMNKLDNNIRPEKIIIILNCFATWAKRKNNEKIVKSDMSNLIIEACLPHYDIFTPQDTNIENGSLIVEILNKNCYFPFVEKSYLEILKKSLLQQIETKFNTKINLGLWHKRMNETDREKVSKSLLGKRNMFSRNVRHNDLFYMLWQSKELPMLVEFTNESKKCIEFILNKFKNCMQTKSFILIYKEIVPTIRRIGGLNKIVNWDMLEKICVSFQEKTPVNLLEVLTNKTILNCITPNILLKLLIEVRTVGKNFDLIPYYIQRKVKMELLNETVLDESSDLFILNDRGNVTIEEYVSEYKKLLRKKQQIIDFKYENRNVLYSELSADKSIELLEVVKEKSKHVLKQKENSEHFDIIKTSGSVDNLRNHLVNDDIFLIKEQELVKFVKKSVNIICNTAGMGKTCLLQSLANNVAPEEWIIYLNLNEHVHKLDSFNYNKDDKKVVEYLIENQITEEDNEFRNFIKELLLLRSKDGYVTLFLDGYDEIIFKQIKEFTQWSTKMNMKILITTRPSKIVELENTLGMLSLKMQHFDPDDQAEFLTKFYEGKGMQQEHINKIIEKVQTFDDTFIGIPLQTKLLAEVLLDVSKEELEEVTIDLVYLYEQFLNKKIDELGEHKRDAYKLFCMKLALTLFFTQEILDCYMDFTDLSGKIKEFKVEFKKDFIISGFTEENLPMFVHRTYAEFLAAQYLYEQLTSENVRKRETWKILQEKLFYMEMVDVRYFLDVIAAKNYKLHKAVLTNNKKTVEELLISEDVEGKDDLGRTALELACSYGKRFDLDTETDIEGLTNLEKHVNMEDNHVNIPLLEQTFTIDMTILQTLLQKKPANTSECNFALKTGSLEILEQISISDQLNQLSQTKKELLLYYCSVHNFPNILSNISTETQTLRKEFNTYLLTHIAAREGNFEVCVELCKKGANIVNDSYGLTLFHVAAKYGHGEFIKKCLEHSQILGEIIDDVDYYNHTPLHFAAKRGHISVVHVMLQNKANLDVRTRWGEHVIHMACSNGRTEVVERLLQHDSFDAKCLNYQDVYSKTPLHYAVTKCDLNTLNLLLSKGANVHIKTFNGTNVLHIACSEDNVEIVERLLDHDGSYLNSRDNYGKTPLHYAAYEGNLSVVNLLLSKGADVRIKTCSGDNVLHCACSSGKTQVVKCLLNHTNLLNAQDNYGKTPLHRAAHEGSFKIVNLLLLTGANVHIKTKKGEHVLHFACSSDKLEVVERLINRDASYINDQDDNGKTPLHYAVRAGNLDIINYLLSKGADSNITDDDGNTVLHEVVENNRNHPIPIIEKILKVNRLLKHVPNKYGATPLDIVIDNNTQYHFYSNVCSDLDSEEYYTRLTTILLL